MADMLEVMDSLLEINNLSWEEIETILGLIQLVQQVSATL